MKNNRNDKSARVHRADILLLAGVLLLSAALYAGYCLWAAPRAGAVEVTVDGELYATLSLARDTSLDIVSEGGQNRLLIENGCARMDTADCPRNVCVHHRAISKAGESIICLPHRVAVTVVGGSDENTVDFVAGRG